MSERIGRENSGQEIPGMEGFLAELKKREVLNKPQTLKERQERPLELSKLNIQELEIELMGELKTVYDHDVSHTEASSLDEYSIDREANTMADIIEAIYMPRLHDVITILRRQKTLNMHRRHIFEKTADILEDNIIKRNKGQEPKQEAA